MDRRIVAARTHVDRRSLVRIAAIYTAITAAGLAIMMPISYGWFGLPTYKIDLMIRNVPRAMETGAMVAVLTAAMMVTAGSGRAAWYTTLLGLLGMLANHAGLPWIEIDSLTTLNYIDALWAGVIVGSLATVAWTSATGTAVYLFGLVSAAVLGDIVQGPTDGEPANPLERALGGAPPIWLILAALVLVTLCVLLRVIDAPVAEAEHQFPLRKILSGVVLILSVASMSRWLAEGADRLPIVIAAVALTVVGAGIAAFLLPDRDGVAVLLMVAFAAAASAVVTVPRPWWADVLAFLAVGVGVLAARRRPLPPVSIAMSLALATATALLVLHGTPTQLTSVLGVVAIGLVGGYSAAAAIPPRAGSAVVSLTALFVPSAAVALRGRPYGRVGYSHEWYRFAPLTHDPKPAYAALGVTVGAGLVIYLLYRLRRADAVR
ncbi:hypothetical protein [Nocardia sp. NPDC048505]|uniref:hypothetical protein n=1 Tax=unclassified Nocardia TaxID=2637762 RepID=UPI0033D9AAC0